MIAPGDADRLSAILRDLTGAGRRVAGLRLNSPGGAMADGVSLADAVRRARIATAVRRDQTCVSACTVVFVAGAERLASYGAHVGVQMAALAEAPAPSDAPSADAASAMLARLALPPAVVETIVAMPPDQTYWLSPADLVAIGTRMLDRPAADRVATARPARALAKVADTQTSVVQRTADAPTALLARRRQEADRQAERRVELDRAAQTAAETRAMAKQQQIADSAKAEDQLADKATQCARRQLTGLVKSGEPAEVLANAAITICSTDMSAMVEGGVQEFRLEQNLASDSPAEGIARERIRASARDRIVALAVQAKAGVGAFSAASN